MGLTVSNPDSTPNPNPNLVLTPNLDPNSIMDSNLVLDQLFSDPSLNLDSVSIRNSPNFRISEHTRRFEKPLLNTLEGFPVDL